MSEQNKDYCRYHFNFIMLHSNFEVAYYSLQRIFK